MPIESSPEAAILRKEIEHLTMEVRQLEPIVYAGQEAQLEIENIQERIRLLEEELLSLHDAESSKVAFEYIPSQNDKRAKAAKPRSLTPTRGYVKKRRW